MRQILCDACGAVVESHGGEVAYRGNRLDFCKGCMEPLLVAVRDRRKVAASDKAKDLGYRPVPYSPPPSADVEAAADVQPPKPKPAPAPETEPAMRPGRAGHRPGYYLDWARRYANIVATGENRPIKVLAGESGMTPEQITQIIFAARNKHGYLTKTDQGQAGGYLTQKAMDEMIQKDIA